MLSEDYRNDCEIFPGFKMKVIKKFWAPIFIIGFLFLGYVIGQIRNSIIAGQGQQMGVLTDLDDEWSSFSLIFENSEEASDNPWGYTAGLINIDDNRCVFLTPNTGVVMYPKELGNASVLQSYIHPWVSDLSDGAGLVIWYLDENDEILGQEEVSIGADTETTEMVIDLGRFQGTNHFKILCNNGGKDDSGDWVIIAVQ